MLCHDQFLVPVSPQLRFCYVNTKTFLAESILYTVLLSSLKSWSYESKPLGPLKFNKCPEHLLDHLRYINFSRCSHAYVFFHDHCLVTFCNSFFFSFFRVPLGTFVLNTGQHYREKCILHAAVSWCFVRTQLQKILLLCKLPNLSILFQEVHVSYYLLQENSQE